ncbi:MAG: C39 family peptidase [Methanocellales archaeon]|nr:C39 family peptidase [Methanocellales archaeon]
MKRGLKLGALLVALLIGMAFVTPVSATPTKDETKVNIIMGDKANGHRGEAHLKDATSDTEVVKVAKIRLIGTLDDDNNLAVSGTCWIGDDKHETTLIGYAEKVFTGWDTDGIDLNDPKNRMESDVGQGNKIIRFVGAEKTYSALVHLEGSDATLDAEFYEDGTGWMHGFITIDGEEYEVALTGKAPALAKNILSDNKVHASLPSSWSLNVPYKSQWSIYYTYWDYTAAKQACGHTSALMIYSYWAGISPSTQSLYNAWKAYPYGVYYAIQCDLINNFYPRDNGVYIFHRASYKFIRGSYDFVEYTTKSYLYYWPDILQTRAAYTNNWHAIVLKGWYDPYNAFRCNDPNSLSGYGSWYTYGQFYQKAYLDTGDYMSNGVIIVE